MDNFQDWYPMKYAPKERQILAWSKREGIKITEWWGFELTPSEWVDFEVNPEYWMELPKEPAA